MVFHQPLAYHHETVVRGRRPSTDRWGPTTQGLERVEVVACRGAGRTGIDLARHVPQRRGWAAPPATRPARNARGGAGVSPLTRSPRDHHRTFNRSYDGALAAP